MEVYSKSLDRRQTSAPFSGLTNLIRCKPDFESTVNLTESLAVRADNSTRALLQSFSPFRFRPFSPLQKTVMQLVWLEYTELKNFIFATHFWKNFELLGVCRSIAPNKSTGIKPLGYYDRAGRFVFLLITHAYLHVHVQSIPKYIRDLKSILSVQILDVTCFAM